MTRRKTSGARATVFALLSKYETYSIVIAEALAKTLLTICTAIAGGIQ